MTVKELREILDKLPPDMEIELNIYDYPFKELSTDRIMIYHGALILNLDRAYAFAMPVEEYLGA